ncbi:MAG: molybdopterin-dependent oxidoreductase [Solirubrobacterales bacterium]|nr:molybdopterin-dependent oxidoreductase [Solirubrobacterales bacterium]
MEKLSELVEESEDARKPPAPPPPNVGPFRRDFWTSPLRGRWLTSFLGSAMLPLLVIAALTGFLSHAAYNPSLGSNDLTGGFEVNLYFFNWPTSPIWLYSLTQSLHLIAGFAVIPILLAKLWSVIPRLFERPPARSIAHVLERLSVMLLVGSSIFLLVTGTVNVEYWLTPLGFAFLPAHYYASMVFIGALALHLTLKLPIVAATFRREGTFRPLGEGIDRMRAADPDVDTLAPIAPAEPTISRRGLLGAVGLGSLGLIVMTSGANLLGGIREIALLSPRGQSGGPAGSGDFQVNKTAELAGISTDKTGSTWRLKLTGGSTDVELTREDLLAMDQFTEHLPIACVEGWTTWQTWTGVRLADLATAAGAAGAATVLVESLQEGGAFSQATLAANQINDDRSLLALQVNGEDLTLDHGFPARVIVPALPGVHNTKWVSTMTFGA